MRNDMDYELVIVYDNGEKEIAEYRTEEQAQKAARGIKMALGNQVQWLGVRRKLI